MIYQICLLNIFLKKKTLPLSQQKKIVPLHPPFMGHKSMFGNAV
jgi:hypothetical protein